MKKLVLEQKEPSDGFNMINGVSIGREFRRLSFLVKRDGIEKAEEFANRGVKLYRKYILSKKGYPFRREVIESYLDFKRFSNSFEETKENEKTATRTRCKYGKGLQDMATCRNIYIHWPGYYPGQSYYYALKKLCPNYEG